MNSIFNAVMGLFSNDLAIDLGTANSLVWMKGEGMGAPRRLKVPANETLSRRHLESL
jgi:actin-like ATPase involved in cell morphogenesis